ncbi:hypothetical protein PHISCL_06490 [Aspergillus sclerotialis]|uniref:RanBD1 domain-containing protein n=1 Tax=Aspergillus sclerotialis TaxID=2070753 RepID=A0A3A2ZIE1_9EURO|nr:hypothetical protein PHISCL_06490 [Aspergillus sclerotialis]
MSKRAAQGPQGDKDSLREFSMASTPDDKPQRATAAQLANRKIKDTRRRRPVSSTPSFGSQQPAPFSSLDPNIVSSNPASQQPPTNGFTFGQTPSFGGTGQSNQSSQGSTPFTFGGGGGASSFNFSSSFNTPATTNPFATMGTGAQSQPPSGNGFGGFQGSIFNLAPASQPPASPAPTQQPLPSTGLFGSNANATGGLTNTAGASDSPKPATPASAFGQNSFNPPTSANPFGQSLFKPATSGATFGQSSPQPSTQFSTFGQSSFNQTTPASTFGQSPFKPTTPFASSGASGTTPFSNGTKLPNGGASSNTIKSPLFGQSPSGNDSMQTSPDAVTSSEKPSLFSSAPAQPSFGAANFGSPAPSFSFGQSSNAKPTFNVGQSPFKSLFEAKPAEQSTPSTTADSSAFSKNESAAPKPTGSLFGDKPAFGAFQPPKPPTFTAEKFQTPAETHATPAAVEKQAPVETPAAEKPQAPFGTPAVEQAQAPAETPAVEKSTAPIETAASEKTKQPTEPPAVEETQPAQNAVPTSTEKLTPLQKFCANMKPRKLPDNLPEEYIEDYVLLWQVRTLNTCLQREIMKLDPAEHDFDRVVMYYTRVRNTLGIPLGYKKPKRKPEEAGASEEGTLQKKIKTSEGSVGEKTPSSSTLGATGTTGFTPSNMNIAPSSITSTSKLFGAEQPTPSHKRKLVDEEDNSPSGHREKRTRDSTVNAFAQSFSKSKSAEGGDSAGTVSEAAKLSSATSTPESSKPSVSSTTPATSPAKPLFQTPTQNAPSVSTSSEPMTAPPAPAFQIPKFGSGTGGTDFMSQFKKKADETAAKEKAKRKAEDFDSDEDDEAEWERKDAEEQRKKREQFESISKKRSKFIPGKGFVFEEESSEAESEKTDQELFVPESPAKSIFENKNMSPAKGKNIFGHLSATPSGDENDEADEGSVTSIREEKDPYFTHEYERDSRRDLENEKAPSVTTYSSSDEGDFHKALAKAKKPEKADAESGESGAATPSGRSLFDRIQYDDSGKPKRHEDAASEEPKEPNTPYSIFGNSKFASSFNTPGATPNVFGQSTKSSFGNNGSFTSSSSNIFGSANTSGTSATSVFSSSQTSTSKSSDDPATKKPLFSFSQPATTKPGDDTASKNTLFSSSLTSAAKPGEDSAVKKPLFSSTQPPTTKPGSDHTWKKTDPIKFGTDGANDSSKSESEASTPAPATPKPFASLFGAKDQSAPKSPASTPSAHFSFGAPSFMTPPTFKPDALSRSSTPGAASDTAVTSDTGADSGDNDGAEALPQADLTRGGAGEENEDVIMETRARALEFKNGTWESKGIGFLRILKDRTTSKARVLVRADPSGKVVLNISLMKEVDYKHSGNAVTFLVPQPDGAKPQQWALRVKKEELDSIASKMEENKS